MTGQLSFAVLLVAGSSIWSISKILAVNEDYADAADHNTFMVEKEVDHLNWANKVRALFVANQTGLEVELDHRQCGLGKFLYGKEGEALRIP